MVSGVLGTVAAAAHTAVTGPVFGHVDERTAHVWPRPKRRPRSAILHREFLAQPGLAEIARTRPMLGTWDDHDFGANDSDGSQIDREAIHTVFTEYRGKGELR